MKVGDKVEWGHAPYAYGTGTVREIVEKTRHTLVNVQTERYHGNIAYPGGTITYLEEVLRPLGTETYLARPYGTTWCEPDPTLCGGLSVAYDKELSVNNAKRIPYYSEWCVVAGSLRRDADAKSANTFSRLCDRIRSLDPSGEKLRWRVLRFSHWAVGWVDMLIVELTPGPVYDYLVRRGRSLKALHAKETAT